MKQNKIAFVGILAFLALLLVSSVSALSVSGSSSLSVTQGSSTSLVLTISNADGENITSLNVSSTTPSSVSYTVNNSNFILNNGTSKAVSVNYLAGSSAPTGLSSQTITMNYLYENGTVSSKTHSLALTVNAADVNFCDLGPKGNNLSISDFDINNNGEGDDEEWYLLDDIEIEVEVSNRADDTIDDVQVEIIILKGSEDVTDDFDLEDERIDLGNIREDDEKVATFVINNIPADMDEGDYTLKVKVYPKGEEDNECKQLSENIELTNPFGEGVVPYDGVIGSVVEVRAGELATEISFDLISFGNDQDEVLVVLYNRELGLNEKININNLDEGDSETVYFDNILIPANAASKTYKVDVTTYFDYDDDDVLDESSYDENSEDDLEDDYNTFSFSLKVIGSSSQQNNSGQVKPLITARLNSEAVVNENLEVEVSVTNNADNSLFVISADNYGSWASLVSVDPSTLSLSKSNTGKSIVTLKPTQEGQQSFVIKVVSNGQVYEQPVTVTIEGQSGLLNNMYSKFGKTTSYLILGIVVLVVLILVILLIKALSSGSRKSRRDED